MPFLWISTGIIAGSIETEIKGDIKNTISGLKQDTFFHQSFFSHPKSNCRFGDESIWPISIYKMYVTYRNYNYNTTNFV